MQNQTKFDLYSQLSDEALVARSEKDLDALEVLISRNSRLVRSIARPLFLVGGDHEDLVQEGMIGLLQAARSYSSDTGSPFSAYAAICIRNKLISAVRAAAANKHAPLNDSVSFHTFSLDVPVTEGMKADPEAMIIGKEGADEFLEALQNKLSASEKEVLTCYLGGLSYAEIASQLSKPEKAVDNAVQRIRRKAIKILGENGRTV